MAKAKTLDEAVDELMKDYKKAAGKAAVYATQQIMDELTDTAYSGLKTYYNTYKPTSYRRTYTLADCIVPFSKISASKDGIDCVMQITYDSSNLEDLYDRTIGDGKPSRFYRGEEVEGKKVPKDLNPINEWIMNNFLDGIHPTTNGSSNVNAPYNPVQRKGIEWIMDKKLKELDKSNSFADYFMISFFDQIMRI